MGNVRICFDMDGTIANLYAVCGWLEYLKAENETPYQIAKVMTNMQALSRMLNNLQRKGFEIGIISWLSKNGSDEYNEKVTAAKKQWLDKHLHSVKFDFIKIVEYGTDKNIVRKSENDILFDDEKRNRDNWGGKAYDVNDILGVLKGLRQSPESTPGRTTHQKIFKKIFQNRLTKLLTV